MKDYWKEEEASSKKINKKKIIIGISIGLIIILITTVIIVYQTNKQVRNWIDKNILRKEVMQDKVTTIEMKEDQHSNIFAFNKYIGVLNKNQFEIYGNTGNKEKTLEIQISNPIFNSESRYLAIAEKKGKKFYIITDKDISWEATTEGNIAQIHVNKNGYVAVVITDTSYKTVVAMYNPEGKEIFKTYLSSTRTADVAISNDDKYLAVAEVDTSGTIIQSNIKVISIEKASNDPTNSIEHTYKGEQDKLITNIKYQDKNKLICMYTDSIHIIENDQDTILINSENKKTIFQSIELTNHAIEIEEKSTGLFTAESIVNIINTENRGIKEYTADAVEKDISTYGNMIALNLGTEIEFINTSGWLVKRYIANQEITNIVLSDSIAGIIYRDSIEIINL